MIQFVITLHNGKYPLIYFCYNADDVYCCLKRAASKFGLLVDLDELMYSLVQMQLGKSKRLCRKGWRVSAYLDDLPY